MHLIVRTDGGSRGNPGPAAAGICVENPAGKVLFSGGFFLGTTTNNVAEYQGILHGLTEAKKLGANRITLYCDSELVTKQLNGLYRVKNAGMKQCYDQVVKVRETFEKVEFIHVLRHMNEHADAMVNESLDMGQDVGGVCDAEGVSDVVEESPCEGAFVEQLTDKVRFDDSGRWREPICRQGEMATDLICLKNGQKGIFEVEGRQGSLCVLRGKGQIILEANSQKVQAGGWVSLEQGQQVRLEAGNKQEFVLLLTVAN